ncbi:unnamed protein product [Echinostoma caproni]|uniref:Transposase n=1 Tax=Echinostoma caproni TaxID=27848 RepID=A0A183B739_9TREM|nr:unnamed protein product [Echinostoma caproni]
MDLIRRFVTELTVIANAFRSPRWPHGLLPACYSGPAIGFSPSWSTWEDAFRDGLFLATPKKRRSLEQRRIRKFLPLNCYNKVRDETNALRSQIGDRLPSDVEIRFHYQDDPTGLTDYPVRSVMVDRSRPSWFPAILLKRAPSGKDES